MDRQFRFSLFIGLMIVLLACVCVVSGSAGDGTPEGLFSWYDPILGATCYVWPDGSGDCYCPCEADCEVSYNETVTTSTPIVPVDTPTPQPEPSSTPTPNDGKASCNRGPGNGAENCDPGNSGGKPGAAGEDNE